MKHPASTDLGAVQVLPLKTPTLPPATHTNSVLVIGKTGAALIEPASGDPGECERMVAWVKGLLGSQPLTHLILTHHHRDHVGGARFAEACFGLRLCCHPLTASRMGRELTDVSPLEEGDRIDLGGASLLVMHTPGHAPGHLCFLEEHSRALIVGDMVASVGTILVEPVDGDMRLYLASLERLQAVSASRVIPAHGPVLDGTADVFRRTHAHRLMREAKVIDALSPTQPQSPKELVPVVYSDANPEVYGLAEQVVSAHLIKLEQEGRAVRNGERYSLGEGLTGAR